MNADLLLRCENALVRHVALLSRTWPDSAEQASLLAAECRSALSAPADTAVRDALPREPTPGLLMSMAIRYDHGLGVPGYYDQPLFAESEITHQQRLESTLRTMRQLWEEVTGAGFYRPEREQEYIALAAPSAQPREKP